LVTKYSTVRIEGPVLFSSKNGTNRHTRQRLGGISLGRRGRICQTKQRFLRKMGDSQEGRRVSKKGVFYCIRLLIDRQKNCRPGGTKGRRSGNINYVRNRRCIECRGEAVKGRFRFAAFNEGRGKAVERKLGC